MKENRVPEMLMRAINLLSALLLPVYVFADCDQSCYLLTLGAIFLLANLVLYLICKSHKLIFLATLIFISHILLVH